jgi:hypothetical protein
MAKHLGMVHRDTFSQEAEALLRETLASAGFQAVKDEALAQLALSMALQAAVNASVAVAQARNTDILKSLAVAFASWATRVADNSDELEDALIAFGNGVRAVSPSMFAQRRA